MGALIFQPDPSLDRATLMHEADSHMYAGKAAGKGQVRVATLHPAGISAIPPDPDGFGAISDCVNASLDWQKPPNQIDYFHEAVPGSRFCSRH